MLRYSMNVAAHHLLRRLCLVAMCLLFSVPVLADDGFWQLTFSYDAAGLALHKAAVIPPMSKRIESPGIEDAPLKLDYDLEWQDAAGQSLLRIPVIVPLGTRSAMEGNLPHE